MNPSSRLFPLTFPAIAVALLCLAPGSVFAQGEPMSDRVIELPPLLVEEAAKPLPWRYVEFRGIEMLSVVSDSETRAFLRRYHNQSEILQWILPLRFQGRSSVPDEYILFNENLSRAHSQEVMTTMMASQRDAARRKQARDKVESGDRESGRERARGGTKIKFLPNLRLMDVDTTAVFVVVRDSDNLAADFTFSMDRIANLLASRVPVLPSWFMAGMMGLYERANFGDDHIAFRPAVWTTPAELAALKDNTEPLRTLLPMAELFARRPRQGPSDARSDRLWRAQCALFVRWAIAEDKGSRREALWQFVDRLANEPATEALFQSYFNVGYADMRDILSDYLPGAVEQPVTLRVAKVPKSPAINLRDATPLDVARIRGDWERLQISFVRKAFPDVVDKYVEQARKTLRKPYDQGERDPRLLGLLGLLDCDSGDRASATPFLEAAVKAQVVRPRLYYELSINRYESAAQSAANGALTRDQIDAISAPILAAWDLQPPNPAACAVVADVWNRTKEEAPADILARLNRAAALFPQVEGLVLRVARLNLRRGDLDHAEKQLLQALSRTSDPKLKKSIETELARISSLRPSADSITLPR